VSSKPGGEQRRETAVEVDYLMDHDEYRELLALDAIGALMPEEASALAAHIATCDECEREASELRDTAASLAYTVDVVEPPAHLRERVLQGIRSGDSVVSFKPEARQAKGNGAGAARVGGRSRPHEKMGSFALLASRPSLRFGAIAAALAIVVLAGLLLMMDLRIRELQAQLAQLSLDLNRTQGELSLARQESQRASEINAIMTAPGAPMLLLAGTEVAPGASARLVVDARSGQAVLATQGLPPAPAGKAYQLWYISDGKPQPGAVFTTDANGRAVLSDRVPAAGRDAKLFAVTLEPAGGVPSPTGSMYLKGAAS
jgi:hypothetical protein